MSAFFIFLRMEKIYDYQSKGDQRISIHYNKLFTPVKILIDDTEVYRFTSKKDVFYGENFTHNNDDFLVRYVKSEDNFEVRINGQYADGSAAHPNAFLKKLAIGPMLFSVLGVVGIIVLFTLNNGIIIQGDSTANTIGIVITLLVVVFRFVIAIGLLKKKHVFYYIGVGWFIFEVIFDVLNVLAGDMMSVGAVLFKSIVIIHFFRKYSNFKKLTAYLKGKKGASASQLLDQ